MILLINKCPLVRMYLLLPKRVSLLLIIIHFVLLLTYSARYSDSRGPVGPFNSGAIDKGKDMSNESVRTMDVESVQFDLLSP